MGHDITQRKLIEAGLLKTEKLESIGILAGDIAHDRNNFLTGIVGSINLAQMSTDTTEEYIRLANAEKSAMQVSHSTANHLFQGRFTY
jgi:signal transduction histidine kinase